MIKTLICILLLQFVVTIPDDTVALVNTINGVSLLSLNTPGNFAVTFTPTNTCFFIKPMATIFQSQHDLSIPPYRLVITGGITFNLDVDRNGYSATTYNQDLIAGSYPRTGYTYIHVTPGVAIVMTLGGLSPVLSQTTATIGVINYGSIDNGLCDTLNGGGSVPVTVSSITNPVAISSIANPVAVSSILGPVVVDSISTPIQVSTLTTVTNPITVGSIVNPVSVGAIVPITVSSIANPITVNSVQNPITVSTVTNPVTVSSVTAPVVVSSITNPVTISNVINPVVVSVVGGITTNVNISPTANPLTTVTPNNAYRLTFSGNLPVFKLNSTLAPFWIVTAPPKTSYNFRLITQKRLDYLGIIVLTIFETATPSNFKSYFITPESIYDINGLDVNTFVNIRLSNVVTTSVTIQLSLLDNVIVPDNIPFGLLYFLA